MTATIHLLLTAKFLVKGSDHYLYYFGFIQLCYPPDLQHIAAVAHTLYVVDMLVNTNILTTWIVHFPIRSDSKIGSIPVIYDLSNLSE